MDGLYVAEDGWFICWKGNMCIVVIYCCIILL